MIYPSYPLEYGDLSQNYKNILFIDNAVDDLTTIVDSINSDTFYIIYSGSSSKVELSILLQTLTMDTIDRIGFFFTLSADSKIFLDRKPFYDSSMNYVESHEIPSDSNFDLLVEIINQYNIKNVDFLACNTLQYQKWNDYYNALMESTNVIVGASDNETGNIKYGGDWILETTGQDIELIYFNKSIQYYKYLLDNFTWVSGLTAAVYGIVVYNGFVYASVTQNPRYLIKVNTTTAAVTLNWSPTLNYPVEVTINPPYIYTCLASNGQIVQLNISDGSIVTSTWVISGSYGGTGSVYTFGGDYMYIINGDTNPNRIQIANLSTRTIVNNNWFSNNAFTYIGDILYNNGFLYISVYTSVNNCYILKMHPTTAAYTIFTSGLHSCAGCAIVGDYVYAINVDNGTISQIRLSTGAIINATWKTGLNTPLSITTDNTYLYIGNANGTISQIDIGPSPINIGTNPTGIKYGTIDICNNFSSINMVTTPLYKGINFSTGIYCYYNSSKYDLAQLYYINASVITTPGFITNMYTTYNGVKYDLTSFFNASIRNISNTSNTSNVSNTSTVSNGSYTLGSGFTLSTINTSGRYLYYATSINGTTMNNPLSTTLIINTTTTVDILMIGGGGNGGNTANAPGGNGGGQGGNAVYAKITLTPATYTITIDSGTVANATYGQGGSNITFSGNGITFQATGGSGGQNNHTPGYNVNPSNGLTSPTTTLVSATSFYYARGSNGQSQNSLGQNGYVIVPTTATISGVTKTTNAWYYATGLALNNSASSSTYSNFYGISYTLVQDNYYYLPIDINMFNDMSGNTKTYNKFHQLGFGAGGTDSQNNPGYSSTNGFVYCGNQTGSPSSATAFQASGVNNYSIGCGGWGANSATPSGKGGPAAIYLYF